MSIRYASLLLVVLLAACSGNKPKVQDDLAGDGSDTRAPLREGFTDEYSDGLVLMEEQRYDEAVTYWTTMTQQAGDEYPGVWTNLALAHYQLGNSDEAIAAYSYVVQLDPEFCPVYTLKGLAERDAGQFDQSQASYEAAIQCQPDNGSAYFNLGILLDLYRNDLAGALDNYRKARRLMPDEEVLNIWVVDLARRTGVDEADPESVDEWQAEVKAEIQRRKAARTADAAVAKDVEGPAATGDVPTTEEAAPDEPVVEAGSGVDAEAQTIEEASNVEAAEPAAEQGTEDAGASEEDGGAEAETTEVSDSEGEQ